MEATCPLPGGTATTRGGRASYIPPKRPGPRGGAFPGWAFSLALAAVLLLACSDRTDPTGPADEDGSSQPGFPTVEEILEQMVDAGDRYPAIARMVDLTARYGTPPTHEGRNLYALKLSDNVGQEEDEPSFLLVAAHHANEIGTPVVALDAIARLTRGYGEDPVLTRLVEDYEIWIAPLWNPDGYPDTRKNGRPGGGVDLNRNYPFLWDSPCSGSPSPSSSSYRGPSPGSEPETKTMMAFSEDQRFAKVLDFHSSGRESLFAYRCTLHELADYLEAEAVALSQASGYGGQTRRPSAEGEHYQWQLGTFSNYAFLTEIGDTQSPSYASALEEAALLWPGTVWMLERPIPVWGHVLDANSGVPVPASVSYVEHPFTQGEKNTAEPLFGRFHAFLSLGSHTLRFSHPGYLTQQIPVTVSEAGVQVEVALLRESVQNVH